jgi:tetratricopeptide (TPR) repeat protein
MRDRTSSTTLHQSAMERAQEAALAQDPEVARELFRRALELERRAAEVWEETRDEEPTRSILYRSAAALAWSSQDYAEAERLARKGLEGRPSGNVVRELDELLEKVYRKVPSLRAS